MKAFKVRVGYETDFYGYPTKEEIAEYFFNEEDARQKFEKEIQAAEIDYDREDYIRERNEYYYEVYEEGEWLITHCAVSLMQKAIL
jgi:hypothetical protein